VSAEGGQLVALDLLRSAGLADAPVAAGRIPRLRVGLIVRVGIIFVGGGGGGVGGLRDARTSAGAEHDLPGCSLALIPDHDYVIAGAIKELGEHIARLAGTVYAKDTLVGG